MIELEDSNIVFPKWRRNDGTSVTLRMDVALEYAFHTERKKLGSMAHLASFLLLPPTLPLV